ncbi:MAG: Rrf2 family transcriptional regulator [Bacteroidetes bacterium]|nr:MAG: Rrf2 family transcriptional regulator [Bacteroidota bacterium]MBL1143474.1 Rrf2 family transcriptional regulator [Bacteroidota bacterium]NOG56277.1 Rrf2 family transcriptional regulator [Bacteroidota bacterium]
MLSNAAKYGIRAIIFLAKNSNETKKIQAINIASGIQSPPAFLAKLLQLLAREDLISSSKGKGGGFYLTPENREHSMLDVIHAIDGKERLKKCFLGIEACNEDNLCEIHNIVVSFRKKMIKDFNEKRIGEFAD